MTGTQPRHPVKVIEESGHFIRPDDLAKEEVCLGSSFHGTSCISSALCPFPMMALDDMIHEPRLVPPATPWVGPLHVEE